MEEPGRLQSMGSLESDTTERLHFHSSLSCTGEGNGNPLQYSCLENPRDGGAWWAAVCGVAESRTRLKRLSSSSSKPVSAVSSSLQLLITLSFQLLRPQIWKSSLTILFLKPNIKSISNLAVVSHILGLRPLLTTSSAITLANLLSTGLAALFPLITSNYSQHCSQNDSQGDVNM